MIVCKQISKIYAVESAAPVVAIKQLNLTFPLQSFNIIIGANGSGKTTFFNLLSGQEKPTQGQIWLNEKDITNLGEIKRSAFIGRVFQNPLKGTAANLTVLENFRLSYLRTHKLSLGWGIPKKFKQHVTEVIAQLNVGLEQRINQKMGSLSGGQRQILTLLMATLGHVEILLLDEPTAALDPASAQIFSSVLLKILAEKKITTFMITHNMNEATQLGNRTITFSKGEVIKDELR